MLRIYHDHKLINGKSFTGKYSKILVVSCLRGKKQYDFPRPRKYTATHSTFPQWAHCFEHKPAVTNILLCCRTASNVNDRLLTGRKGQVRDVGIWGNHGPFLCFADENKICQCQLRLERAHGELSAGPVTGWAPLTKDRVGSDRLDLTLASDPHQGAWGLTLGFSYSHGSYY